MNETEENARSYRMLLRRCLESGYPSAPRGKPTLELLDAEITLWPTPTLVRGAMDRPYAEREMKWYLGRSRDPSYVAEIAKLWDNCRNPDGTINSNYGALVANLHGTDFGERMMSEWDWALQSLMHDLDSRQAVMVYHRPEHHWFGNRDVPCTLTESFMVRHDELTTRVHMRSSDLWYGLPFDIIWHQYLHNQMLDALRAFYPEKLQKPGRIIMRLDSAHLYDKHIERSTKFLTDPPREEAL